MRALLLATAAALAAWLLLRPREAQAAAPSDAGSGAGPSGLGSAFDSFSSMINSTIQSLGAGSNMTTSDAGRAAIEQFEGFSATVYLDTAGNPTIGYGHKLQPGESYPDGITRAQADQLEAQDLKSAEDAVNSSVTVALTQAQFDALVSFTYNEGAGAVARSTLLADVNAGDFAAAADQFQRWVYAGGSISQALVKRRAWESRMFASGEYPPAGGAYA